MKHSLNRIRFETLREKIGEDPARFLDWNLVDDVDARELAFARIRGIDSIEVIRAWKAVERNLAKQRNRQPRRQVLEKLEQREETLSEIGERPDRLQHGPILPPEFFDSESVADVENEETTAHQKLSRMRAQEGRA